MKGNRTIFITLLTVFFIFSVCLQGQGRFDPFFIVQMSDPQFGFFENNRAFDRETELYEKAIETINRIKPDFVVITGDFVNDNSNQDQLAEFNRITDKIDSSIPVFLTPGNHDIGQVPSKDDIKKYNAVYGYDRFSLRHKECLFIGINSSIIKSGEKNLEEEQLDWLKNELAENRKARHKIIFCHYPFFINSPDEPESYSNIGIELRTKYLDLFSDYDVNAVFSGHLHNNASSFTGKTEMVVTSAVGKPLGQAPSGIRIIFVFRNRIESSFFSLDEVPESILFIRNRQVRY